MSLYGSGGAAYRDATKWLIGFAPIASMIAVGGAVVAPLAQQNGTSSVDSALWLGVGIAFVLIGIALVLGAGSAVLLTHANDFSEISSKPSQLDAAFAAGVGVPYYFASTKFIDEMQELASGTAAPDSDVAKRALHVTGPLQEWALTQRLRSRWGYFVGFFVLGLSMTLGGLVLSALNIRDVPVQPIRVELRGPIPSSGVASDRFDCRDPENAEFWLVAGTWDEPVLEVDGPGCSGIRWTPRDGTDARPTQAN